MMPVRVQIGASIYVSYYCYHQEIWYTRLKWGSLAMNTTHTHACMLHPFSCVQLFATLWTEACQAPLSMGFSRQEYWRGVSYPPPGDLSNPGIKPMSLTSPALVGRFLGSTTWEAHETYNLALWSRLQNSFSTCDIKALNPLELDFC